MLRARAAGVDRELVAGAELIAVDGRPAALVLDDLRRRLRRWQGWSTAALLDARLGTTFFAFDGRRSLEAEFLLPDGRVVDCELSPGVHLSRAAHSLPAGLSAAGLAVAKRLDGDVGYIRILGAMGPPTRRAFDAAMDRLAGLRGILLDCRGMGGGSTRVAWSIAGRFHPRPVEMPGAFHDMAPTGSWQFEGPVVMLQDELELSAAEGFTLAMTEHERVISVGRPTAGVTMIPSVFTVPSGLFRYRISCHDVIAWRSAYSPEGVGIAPDVRVPYSASLLTRCADPCFEVGRAVLGARLAGRSRTEVIKSYAALLTPAAARLPSGAEVGGDAFTEFLRGDHIVAWIDEELRSAHCPGKLPTTVRSAIARLERLGELATRLRLGPAAARARSGIAQLRAR